MKAQAQEQDIVELLRTMRPTLAPYWTGLLNDAADEIVRLRNKIQEMEEHSYVVSQLP
jgi:hypothetical protein